MGYSSSWTVFKKMTPAQAAQIAVGDMWSSGSDSGTISSIKYIGADDVGDMQSGKFERHGLGYYAVGLSGTGNPPKTTSNVNLTITRKRKSATNNVWGSQVRVYDGWRFETSGFWAGTIYLERYDENEGRWVLLKTYTSVESPEAARNYSDSGDFDEPTLIRIRSTDFKTFVPEDNDDKDRGYAVLIANQAEHRGWARIKTVTNSKTVTADVGSAFANTNATNLWRLGSWNPEWGYPNSVGFYQDRLVFGGSKKEPQTVWLSKTSDYYNFGTSHPLVDDDAITATIAARQINGIQHIVPLDSLVILTGGAEWVISSDGALSPTNLQAKPQSYRGSSVVEPVVIGNMVLFVQQHGRRVRDLGYTYESDSYTGNDLSVMAPHLMNGFSIRDWCYTQEPHTCLWIVRSDGVLLSLTYLREQNVVAWARHNSNGLVLSVASIPGERGDDVYLYTVRNGVKCIEIMHPWLQPNTADDVAYLDSYCESRNDNGVDYLKGMNHLKNRKVQVMADGSYLGEYTVSANGTLKLPYKRKHVTVGFGYRSKLNTLDINTNRQDGAQMTRKARVVSVGIRVDKTRGIFAGVDEAHLEEHIDRTSEAYNDPTRLATTDIHLRLDSSYESYGAGAVWVETKFPLPASIQAIIPEVSLGG